MKRRGFTLVELIIALSLSAVLMTGVFYSLGQGVRSWRTIADKSAKAQVKNIVAERITSDIRAARAITAGSNSEEVILEIGTEAIGYKLVDRKIRRRKDASYAYITSEDEAGKLIFSYPSAGVVEVKLDDLVWKAAVQ